MSRLAMAVVAVVVCACGSTSSTDGGTGGGSATGGGTGGGTTTGGGTGGGSSTGGGGGTFLTDGGMVFTLTGDTAFTPTRAVAGASLVDGGIITELTIVYHDQATTNACDNVSNSVAFNAVQIHLYNLDGGSVVPGTYAISETPVAGLAAQLTNTGFTPQGMTNAGGAGVGGTVTLGELTETRSAGSFQATMFLAADGGSGTLSGSWDSVRCQ